MPRIILLTEPAASGKNAIAHVYATEFSMHCAVIDGDLVRWMLRQPHLAPWPTDAPESPPRPNTAWGSHTAVCWRGPLWSTGPR